MIKTLLYLFFLKISLIFCSKYISPTSTCSPCDGTLAKPYPSIVSALTDLGYYSGSFGGDVFILMDGVYTGIQNTKITFKNLVFKLISLNGPTYTIIDCMNQNYGFIFTNGNYNVSLLTIQNCLKPTQGGVPTSSNSGGALYLELGTLDIWETTFLYNSADYGGAYALNQGTSNIFSSIFRNNQAFSDGGAFYEISASATITNCVIWFNSAIVSGGGFYISSSSFLVISSNITNNSLITTKNSQFGCSQSNVKLNTQTMTTVDGECKQCDFSQNSFCFCPRQAYVGTSCVDCDSSCLTCIGGSYTQCTSCVLSYASVSGSFGQCLCSQGYYNNTMACVPCDPSCLDCNGGAASNCLNCYMGFTLEGNGYCIKICSGNQYYDKKSKICLDCDNSCLTCFGGLLNNCLSCENGAFFANYQCIVFQENTNNQTNLTITTNNTSSNGNNSNLITNINNNNSEIFLNIFEIEKNYIYKVIFSSYLPNLLENLQNSIIITITNFTVFSFNVTNNSTETNSTIYKILINYHNLSYFPPETILNITFNPNSLISNNSGYILMNTTFSYSLDNFLFQINENFELAYTEELNVIKLTIEDFSYEINDSLIEIDSFKLNSDYIYLIETSSPSIFLINFYYFKPLVGRKNLYVTPPGFKHAKSIKLFDFYTDPSLLETMKTLANQADVFELLTKIMLIISLSQKDNCEGIVHNMMLIELIFILKYVDLDYPQNLVEFFIARTKNLRHYFYDGKSNPENIDKEEIPPLFELYEITPYFIDYTLDLLLQNLFFFSLSILILIFSSKKIQLFIKKFRICLKIHVFFKNVLIWEYVIFIYLTNFQEVLFKTFCPIKFPTISVPKGYLIYVFLL